MVKDVQFIVLVPTEDQGLVAYTSHQFTETQRTAIVHMARNAGVTPPAPAVCVVPGSLLVGEYAMTPVTIPSPAPGLPGTVVARAPTERTRPVGQAQKVAASLRAKDQGYTGNPCTSCGGFNVKRNGSCEVCESCGSTTGCS